MVQRACCGMKIMTWRYCNTNEEVTYGRRFLKLLTACVKAKVQALVVLYSVTEWLELGKRTDGRNRTFRKLKWQRQDSHPRTLKTKSMEMQNIFHKLNKPKDSNKNLEQKINFQISSNRRWQGVEYFAFPNVISSFSPKSQPDNFLSAVCRDYSCYFIMTIPPGARHRMSSAGSEEANGSSMGKSQCSPVMPGKCQPSILLC